MKFDGNALRIALLMTGMALFTQVYCQNNGQWIWQGGDNAANTAGTYGTMGVASSANRPPARESYASWTDAAGNFWIFGGIDTYYNHSFNDLWKYTPSTKQWTWVGGSSSPNAKGIYGNVGNGSIYYMPGARSGAVGFMDAQGSVWIFGGYGYDARGYPGYLNDLWQCDPDNGLWEWESGNNGSDYYGLYGTLKTPDPSNTPGGRSNLFGGEDVDGNIWIFGGAGYDVNAAFGNLNDVWEFSRIYREWIWMGGNNTANGSASYGTRGSEVAGNKPGARNQFFGWMDANDNMWIFGGTGKTAKSSGTLNDLWKYSTTSGLWTWMGGSSSPNASGVYGTQGTPADGNSPGARTQPFGTTDAVGNLWLFGGTGYDVNGGNGDLDDCWEYNSGTNQWTWINGQNTIGQSPVYPPTQGTVNAGNDPGGRSAGNAWMDASGNFWLMGGSSSASTYTDRNDIWQLNFSPYLQPSGQEGQWTWIGGNNTANSREIIAHSGQPQTVNLPGARSGQSYGTDGVGNFWLFGGNGYDAKSSPGLLNDLWTYSPLNNSWRLAQGDTLINQFGAYGTQGVIAPDNTPGSRSGQTGCIDNNANFWVFGGNGYAASGSSGGLNDLWELSSQKTAWTWISGSNTINTGPSYGTLGVAVAGNMPGYRTASCSATDQFRNFWLYGGVGKDAIGTVGELDDLWKYSPSARQWTWMAGHNVSGSATQYNAGGYPGARESSIMWSDASNNLWLFGGYSKVDGYYDDLWEFTHQGTWIWKGGDQSTSPAAHPGVYGNMGIAASTNWPGARKSAIVTLDATGNVWLFGGYGYDANGHPGVLGDLWKYSPKSGQWTWMGGDNTANNAAVYGIQGSGNLGDKPGSRQLSAGWVDRMGNFWLMGGADFAGQKNNDLWKFTQLTPVLAIEDVTLEGQAGQNENSLTWQTIGELNTAGFEVERSTDGTDFTDIGSVTAVGSGNNSYSFMDTQLPPSTRYFYRLKMSDKDGTVTYSQTIVLYTVAPSGLSVYPNPTHGSVILQLKDNSLLNTPLKLLSIDGRQIRQYLITGQQQQLDLTGVSNGVYLLQFANGSTVKVLRE